MERGLDLICWLCYLTEGLHCYAPVSSYVSEANNPAFYHQDVVRT